MKMPSITLSPARLAAAFCSAAFVLPPVAFADDASSGRVECEYVNQAAMPAGDAAGRTIIVATARCVSTSGPVIGASGLIQTLAQIDANGNGSYLDGFGHLSDGKNHASWITTDGTIVTKLVDGKPVTTGRGATRMVSAVGPGAVLLGRPMTWKLTPVSETKFVIDHVSH